MSKSSKIPSYSDLYIRKRKESSLDSIEHYDYATYEKATDLAIDAHKEKLKEYIAIYEQASNEIDKLYAKLGHYQSEAHHYLISKFLLYEEKVNQNKAYLNSLYEMKIIYLYKNLELSINFLIKEAYPVVNIKSFYRIEMIKSFFDSKGIDISKIEGYEEFQDLRKVNNCIKHHGKISFDIKKIREFKNKDSLDYETLQVFYSRIKVEVQLFIKKLKNEIKVDLFHFSDARLDKLVKQYYERMDEDTFLKFVEKMKDKAV